MRDILQDDSPRSGFLELSNSEQARVVSEHFSTVGQQFGKYSGLVIPRFPYFILRSIQEDIFLDRMSMEVKEHDQPIFPLLFKLYYQLF